MIQPYVEKIIAWSTGPERQEELLRAKASYFEKTGEIYDDDKSFESRMAAFLEYFLFDRPLDGDGRPPVAAFVGVHGPSLPPEEAGTFENLAKSVHGVFEVRKLGTKAGLRIREVLTGEDYEIFERRGLVAIEKGDILEARLVPYGDGTYVFTGSFVYHPREARKAILKEARRRKKAEGEPSSARFAWDLARLALKLERYRNVPVTNIYKFE